MYLKAVLKRIPFTLLLLLLFPFLSCTEEKEQYLETVPFKTGDGKIRYLRVYPGKDAPSEVAEKPGALFLKSKEDIWTTGVFHIPPLGISQQKSTTSTNLRDESKTEGILPAAGSALGLYCSSGEGGSFTIILYYSGENKPSIQKYTAPPGEKVEFRIPLDGEKRLVSFEITSSKGETGFILLETGITGPSQGFIRKNGVLLISPTLRISSQAPWLIEYQPRAEEHDALTHHASLVIEYNLKKRDAEEKLFFGELLLTGEKNAESEGDKQRVLYKVSFRHGIRRVVLPITRIGFIPKKVQLRGLDPRECLVLSLEPRDAISPQGPIESELSAVLEYPQEKWRGEDWELFRWSAAPDFLILDTADYGVQAGFFKRLSFFVEKVGFSGTLLTEEEIENRHGWNAHDYRAFDLARFFQLAEDNRMDFTQEEKELRSILLENEIIDKIDGVYHPGKGGILSISRESPGYLRRKFLIHEGLHGLFFSFSRFREGSFALWEGLEEEEQRFFRIFFRKMTYDSSQLYLSVNEYQAYMLQQPVEEIEAYFRAHWASRQIWRDYPELAAWYDDHPGIFESRALEVEALLEETTGFKAGDIFCLTRVAAEEN